MNLREGILDALVDGGESIVQIAVYLDYLDIHWSRARIISELNQLLEDGVIHIEHPLDANNAKLTEDDEVEE